MIKADIETRNKEIMEDTYARCQEAEIATCTLQSIKQTSLYNVLEVKHEVNTPTIIRVTKNTTLQAAKNISYYACDSVCVLDFANAVNPGGRPYKSSAQEESICRASNLLPILESFNNTYYAKHANIDWKGTDDMLYIPNVQVFKDDDELLEIPYPIDVIVAAAPCLRNESIVDSRTLECVLRNRINQILLIAEEHKVENLVLGAFGCGAFKCPPLLVARLFKEELKYFNSFKYIEFAVYCTDKDSYNYDTFKAVFA